MKNREDNSESFKESEEDSHNFELESIDYETLVDDESSRVMEDGATLLDEMCKNTSLSSEEIEDTKKETGILKKLKGINERVENLMSVTKRKIRKTLKIAPSVRSKHGFSPEDTLKEIGTESGNSKKEKLADFYEKYLYQKSGLAIIQNKIIQELKNNPDMSKDDLLEINKAYYDKFGINEKQKDRIGEVFDNYKVKRGNVKGFTEKYPDPIEMFEKIFKFKPSGDIKVIDDSVSIGIEIYKEEDFDKAYTYALSLIGRDDDKSGTINGTRLGEIGIPALHRTIILVNNELHLKSGQDVAETIEHEQQHVINALFYKNVFDKKKLDDVYEKVLNSNSEEDRELFVNRFLRGIRKTFELAATDEILSMYKEGQDRIVIISAMLELGTSYDYLKGARINEKNRLLRDLGYEDEEMIDRCIATVFNSEYKNMIIEAVNSIHSIDLDENVSKDYVIALFIDEPIKKWPKILERFKKMS